MAREFRYRGWVVSGAEVEFIREWIASHPEASRCQLSRQLCEARGWKQANGALRDGICRSLLVQLQRAGEIELPPVRWELPPRWQKGRGRTAEIETTPLRAALSAIRPLDFHQVRRTPEEPLFHSLLEQYHPLGDARLVGENLQYLVYAVGRPIACLAWSAAPRHLGSRDRYIGWSAEARRRNLRFLAYNARYLLLPWVEVEHLASHLLGRMAKVLGRDWERIYGHPIYFLETFVDPQRYRGTCYRAANWVVLGPTTGRGKDCPNKRPNRSIKEVLGYALTPRFRPLLAEG